MTTFHTEEVVGGTKDDPDPLSSSRLKDLSRNEILDALYDAAETGDRDTLARLGNLCVSLAQSEKSVGARTDLSRYAELAGQLANEIPEDIT